MDLGLLLIILVLGVALLVVLVAVVVAMPISAALIGVLFTQLTRGLVQWILRVRLPNVFSIVLAILGVMRLLDLVLGGFVGVLVLGFLWLVGPSLDRAISGGFSAALLAAPFFLVVALPLSALFVWLSYPFNNVPIKYNFRNLFV